MGLKIQEGIQSVVRYSVWRFVVSIQKHKSTANGNTIILLWYKSRAAPKWW